MKLYKIVVKDTNGKVVQIHEVYRPQVHVTVLYELDSGFRVTVTEISKW